MWRKLLWALLGAGLLIGATHLALTAWANSRLGRFEMVWAEQLFDGRPPSEVYPTRSANETAQVVERTAAELGIAFRPQGVAGREAVAKPGRSYEESAASVNATVSPPRSLGVRGRSGADTAG